MRKFFIALIGGTVLLIGLALVVLPGPGTPLVLAGLAILATQFLWARRALRRTKGAVAKARRKSGLAAWLRRRKEHAKESNPARPDAGAPRLTTNPPPSQPAPATTP